jgi:cell wall-associated NlpC family hydrolase
VAPPAATAEPGTAAEAAELVAQTAQQLTVVDEQVHAAELLVQEQQQQAAAAAAAAAEAQSALTALEPQLRAIAETGFTGMSGQMAAFLTSDSAEDLVQQMTTLDVIASHADTVVAAADAAQDLAEAAQAEADAAAALAQAGLAELEAQKAELQRQTAEYQASFDRLTAEEQATVAAAVGGRSIAAPDLASLGLDPSAAAATVISTALSKVGSPYAWGASGPDSFDCSGFTSYAYAAIGVSLPHSSSAQSGVGRSVSRSELQPGDLVFFYSPISHVGLYIGNGMMVHARTYGSPVAVVSVDQSGYAGASRPLG